MLVRRNLAVYIMLRLYAQHMTCEREGERRLRDAGMRTDWPESNRPAWPCPAIDFEPKGVQRGRRTIKLRSNDALHSRVL